MHRVDAFCKREQIAWYLQFREAFGICDRRKTSSCLQRNRNSFDGKGISGDPHRHWHTILQHNRERGGWPFGVKQVRQITNSWFGQMLHIQLTDRTDRSLVAGNGVRKTNLPTNGFANPLSIRCQKVRSVIPQHFDNSPTNRLIFFVNDLVHNTVQRRISVGRGFPRHGQTDRNRTVTHLHLCRYLTRSHNRIRDDSQSGLQRNILLVDTPDSVKRDALLGKAIFIQQDRDAMLQCDLTNDFIHRLPGNNAQRYGLAQGTLCRVVSLRHQTLNFIFGQFSRGIKNRF